MALKVEMDMCKEAFGLDVEHQPSAGDSGPVNSDSTFLSRQSVSSSAPRSRKRRFVFVAAPVCLLALCCVVASEVLNRSVQDQTPSAQEKTDDNDGTQPMLMGKTGKEKTDDNDGPQPMLMGKTGKDPGEQTELHPQSPLTASELQTELPVKLSKGQTSSFQADGERTDFSGTESSEELNLSELDASVYGSSSDDRAWDERGTKGLEGKEEMKGDNKTGKEMKGDNKTGKGLHFKTITTYQSLTGELVGMTKELYLQLAERFFLDGTLLWESGQDLVASPQGSSPLLMTFRELSNEENTTCEIWPGPISPKPTDAIDGFFPLGWRANGVRQNSKFRVRSCAIAVKTKNARFKQGAMRVLLGSVRGTLPPHGPASPRTWTSLAASFLGACIGAFPAKAQKAAQKVAFGAEAAEWGAANGWLASELLVRRATADGEPLVLTAKLQEQVADMEEASRSQFLSELTLEYADGEATAVSAYAVIVQVFRLVQDFTNIGVTTILDVGEVFSGDEIEQAIKMLVPKAKWCSGVQNLMRAATAADQDPSAEARRCGPRFLLRCLLLLEKECNGEDSERSLAKDQAAVECLKKKVPKTLNTSLLEGLAKSNLNIWRGGPMEIDAIFPEDFFLWRSSTVVFEPKSFLEIMGDRVASEMEQSSFQQVPALDNATGAIPL